jgi:hypothetical protein
MPVHQSLSYQLFRWRNSADNQRRENTVYFFYFDQLFFTRRAFRNLSSILLYDYTVLSYNTTLSEENICTSSSFCPNYTSEKLQVCNFLWKNDIVFFLLTSSSVPVQACAFLHCVMYIVHCSKYMPIFLYPVKIVTVSCCYYQLKCIRIWSYSDYRMSHMKYCYFCLLLFIVCCVIMLLAPRCTCLYIFSLKFESVNKFFLFLFILLVCTKIEL